MVISVREVVAGNRHLGGMRTFFFSTLLLILACAATCTAQTIDKRDLVTREWNTDVGTNVRFLDHETIHDSQGRKIQETEYTKLGKLWTKKYEYGRDGKVSRELTYNDKGRLDSVQKFEYNEFGKKKTVYTYDSKGRLVKTKVIEYIMREHED